MNVLVACEFSGTVREAFRRRGHNAWSCDLLPAEDGSPFHYQRDVLDLINIGEWHMVIAHPPCTYLCNSGVRWLVRGGERINPPRWGAMRKAAEFFKTLLDAPIERKAIENPIMHRYAVQIVGRKADQYIQPWQFGHGETKKTGLWLENLPKLKPTDIVEGREARVHRMAPGPDRWKERSRFYRGIADAMADQWGSL